MSINKNSVHGDANAVSPGGVRLGTPALTTRGLTPAHFGLVAHFLHRAVEISLAIQSQCQSKLLKDFVAAAADNPKIAELKIEVEAFACQFPMPGY